MHRSQLKWILASLALLAGSPFAHGDAIINVNQVGSDVVAIGSGTIDLTGLTLNSSGGAAPTPRIGPAQDFLEGPTSGAIADLYTGISGPVIGNGTITEPTSGSGDEFGILSGIYLAVPNGYISGAALSATDTYSGATLASLGLTPGTYKYTWGSGTGALTVQVGPAAAPLPSAFTGGSICLALLAGSSWRQRRGNT